jgi:hypothetical protein
VLISCTTVCIVIPVPLSSPEKNIPNTAPSKSAIRQITIITTTAIQPPAAIAAIRDFVAAIIALTVAMMALTVAFTPVAIDFAVVLAACAAL